MSKQQTPKTRISPKTGNKQELRNGRWHNVEINTTSAKKTKKKTTKKSLDEIRNEIYDSDQGNTSFGDVDDINETVRFTELIVKDIEELRWSIYSDNDLVDNDIVDFNPGIKQLINPDSDDPYHAGDEEYVESPSITIEKPYKFHADLFPDLKPVDLVELEMKDLLITGKDFFLGVYGSYYGDEFDGMFLTRDGKKKLAGIQAFVDFKDNNPHLSDDDTEDRDDYIDMVQDEMNLEERKTWNDREYRGR